MISGKDYANGSLKSAKSSESPDVGTGTERFQRFWTWIVETMMITIIKKKVSSGGRAALRDNMVSLAQDEGHPHLSQGGVGMLLSNTFSQNRTEKGGCLPTPHRTQHGPSTLNTGRKVATFWHLGCCLEMFWESSTWWQSVFSQRNSRSLCDQTLEDISAFGKMGECPAITGDSQ